MVPARVVLLLAVVAAACCKAPAPATPRGRRVEPAAPRPTGDTPGDIFAGTQRRAQWVMGTSLTIALAVPRGGDVAKIFAESFAEARRLDALLSHYRPTSALSQLSARAGAPMAPIAPALYAFLLRSRRLAVLTNGAFDITLGALLATYRTHRGAPPAAALTKARARAGYRHLALRAPSSAALAAPGVRLDPGAIGKGYAIDAIVAVLRRHGVRRAFVDFGGSTFYGLGAPAGGVGWPVLLAGTDANRPIGLVALSNASLSSSRARPLNGDGTRGAAHIIDGRSGRPVVAMRFAAVVARSATDADALSTALIVNPELAARLARARGVASVTQEAGKTPAYAGGLAARLRPLGRATGTR